MNSQKYHEDGGKQEQNKGRCGKDLNLKNKYKISAEKSQKKRTLRHM